MVPSASSFRYEFDRQTFRSLTLDRGFPVARKCGDVEVPNSVLMIEACMKVYQQVSPGYLYDETSQYSLYPFESGGAAPTARVT